MMSSSLTTVTTVLTGANYHEWHVSMRAYLQSTGTWWTIREARPVADAESWDGDNEKAMGSDYYPPLHRSDQNPGSRKDDR